jgi:predicted amidohydrolase
MTAATYELDGHSLAFTICRDSYFPAWDTQLEDVDIWLDLRANGEAYTPEDRSRFRDTLPERVSRNDAFLGVNSSLTGRLLGFMWEGPSYAVDSRGTRMAESPSPVGPGFVVAELDGTRAEAYSVPVSPYPGGGVGTRSRAP